MQTYLRWHIVAGVAAALAVGACHLAIGLDEFTRSPGVAAQGGGGSGTASGGGSGMMLPLDCSSPELWACYGFEGDTVDEMGAFPFTGNSPVFAAVPGGKVFDVTASGRHSADGPSSSTEQLTIEMCFYANTLPPLGESIRLYRREQWVQINISATSGLPPRLGFTVDGKYNKNEGAIVERTWYHTALVFDGLQDIIQIHVSGHQPAAFAAAADLDITTADPRDLTTLGYPGYQNAPDFDGYIDNLRVFHSVRTAAEIAAAAANCPQ